MIDVMLAGLCDPSRFRRGRDYARQGAVVDLVVTSGVATARVQGSRAQPYTVTLRTTLVDAADATERLSALVPSRDEVNFDCDCPDWDIPCKHAIAAMVHLSERIAYEPALLVRWRAAEPSLATPRATVGSRASAPRPEKSAPSTHLDAEARAALDAFLGTRAAIAMPNLGAAPPPPNAWDEPWTFMLEDALAALSRAQR
jgi:uncharacterized Zn finger protein